MSSVCVILGYGPGVSDAVLDAFVNSGKFKLALVARSLPRLEAAAAKHAGRAEVKVFTADFSVPAQVVTVLADIQASLGAIDVCIYNAAATAPFDATPEQLAAAINVNVVSMHSAYNTLLPQFKARGAGVFLLTGGGFALNGAWSVGLGFQLGAAAKAYFRNFAQSASATHKGAGVHVCCMTVMSMINSDLIKDVADDAAFRVVCGDAYLRAATADKADWVDEVQVKP